MPRSRAVRPAGLSLARRAVVLWAVLAGLFLMHGAESPTACCQGDTPVIAMTVSGLPVTPVADLVPEAGQRTSVGMTVVQARHAGMPAPAVAPAAAGQVRDTCGDGMLCSSRPPAGAVAVALAVPPVGIAVLAAAPASARPAATFRRPCRPPGKPGLPLPLFLGVSRT